MTPGGILQGPTSLPPPRLLFRERQKRVTCSEGEARRAFERSVSRQWERWGNAPQKCGLPTLSFALPPFPILFLRGSSLTPNRGLPFSARPLLTVRFRGASWPRTAQGTRVPGCFPGLWGGCECKAPPFDTPGGDGSLAGVKACLINVRRASLRP